jgi:hypothetical protein
MIILISGAVSVYSHEGPMTIDEQIVRMKSDLNLTDAQALAIKPIMQEVMAKYRTLMSGRNDRQSMEESFPAQQALRDEENAKFSKIFTADQLKRWLYIENERLKGRK